MLLAGLLLTTRQNQWSDQVRTNNTRVERHPTHVYDRVLGRQATHLGSRRAQDPQVHGRRRRRHRADSQAPEQTRQHHDHRAVPPTR